LIIILLATNKLQQLVEADKLETDYLRNTLFATYYTKSIMGKPHPENPKTMVFQRFPQIGLLKTKKEGNKFNFVLWAKSVGTWTFLFSRT